MKYRVINEDTWEGFTVEGESVAECQLKADVECELRGWSVMVMRSERWRREVKRQPVDCFKLFPAILAAGIAVIALHAAIYTVGVLQVVFLVETVALIVLSAAYLIKAMFEVKDE